MEEAEATGKVNFHITALPAPYVHFIEQSGGIHSPNAAPASVTPSAPELEVVRFFFEPFGQELGSFLPGGPAVPSAVGRVAVDIHQGGRVQYSSRSILSPYEAFEFFNDVVRPQHSAASATTTARTMACRTRRRSWLTRERGAGGLPRNAKRHRPLAGGGVAMSQTGAAQPRNGGGSMARAMAGGVGGGGQRARAVGAAGGVGGGVMSLEDSRGTGLVETDQRPATTTIERSLSMERWIQRPAG